MTPRLVMRSLQRNNIYYPVMFSEDMQMYRAADVLVWGVDELLDSHLLYINLKILFFLFGVLFRSLYWVLVF